MARGWSSGRFGTANSSRRYGRTAPTNRRPRTVGDVYAAVVRLKAELRNQAARLMLRQADILLELQRDQMYAGLDAEGKAITPLYSQDPWFKSRESAARYAAWKKTLRQRTPARYLPPRPDDVPNLIITGTLIYDRLELTVNMLGAEVRLPSFNITAKYGQVLGFSPLVLDHYRRNYFWPRYNTIMRQILERNL